MPSLHLRSGSQPVLQYTLHRHLTEGLVQIIKSEEEEVVTVTDPAKLVSDLSGQKAREVAGRYHEYAWALNSAYEKTIIIGADTVVAANGRILGKPADEDVAVSMLMALSGKEHEVLTGVHVICLDRDGNEVKSDSFDFVENGYVDSMGLVQFVAILEDDFDIEFTAEELLSDEFKTVGGLEKIITSKIQ